MKSIIIRVREYRPRPNQRRTPNNEEFGRAGKSSGLIRQAFYSLLQGDKKCQQLGKLTQRLLMIQQTDPVNDWGKRTVQHGNIELLEGYDFNLQRNLWNTLQMPVKAAICGVTGICSVVIPPFFPYERLRYESDPSHVRFSIAAACFDFESGWYSSQVAHSNYLPMQQEVELKLMTMVEVKDEQPIFLLLKIEFFKQVNKQYLPMRAGGGVCLQVVKTGRGITAA